MNNTNRLSHSGWEFKHHVVWIPKFRRKPLYGQLRKNLGEVLHELARQKESKILEGHLQSDHVHMMVPIPPKYVVSQVIGYMRGISAIHIARNYFGQRKNYGGMSFWARGYHEQGTDMVNTMISLYLENCVNRKILWLADSKILTRVNYTI